MIIPTPQKQTTTQKKNVKKETLKNLYDSKSVQNQDLSVLKL